MKKLTKVIFITSLILNVIFIVAFLFRDLSLNSWGYVLFTLENRSVKDIKNVQLDLSNHRGINEILKLDFFAHQSKAIFVAQVFIQGESDLTIEFIDNDSNLHKETIIGYTEGPLKEEVKIIINEDFTVSSSEQ